MVKQGSLLDDLRAILGDNNAGPPTDNNDFAVDGISPQVVAQPTTYDQLAAVMRMANERQLSVIPVDPAFSHLGNVPKRNDIAISTTHLSEVIEYQPSDLTLTCQTGVTLANLTKVLDPAGQMWPGGRRPSAAATVGWLLARSAFRQPNLQYGEERDFTIGMRVVTGDGRIVRAGGNVVKNVAGYDLCKLFIGSLDTLGIIVEGTFKLAPAPKASHEFEFEVSSFDDAYRFSTLLYERGLSLWSVKAWRPTGWKSGSLRPSGRHGLVVTLSGTESGVNESRNEILRMAEEFAIRPWSRVEFGTPEAAPQWAEEAGRLEVEISVLPSLLPNLVRELDKIAPGGSIEATPISGIVTVDWYDLGQGDKLIEGTRAVVSRLGGRMTVTDCSLDLKRRIDVFGDVPPKTLDLMRRIKQEFDPNGILSPGRFVGKL
jgi:glycolate oxidase FAD binding subunit